MDLEFSARRPRFAPHSGSRAERWRHHSRKPQWSTVSRDHSNLPEHCCSAGGESAARWATEVFCLRIAETAERSFPNQVSVPATFLRVILSEVASANASYGGPVESRAAPGRSGRPRHRHVPAEAGGSRSVRLEFQEIFFAAAAVGCYGRGKVNEVGG